MKVHDPATDQGRIYRALVGHPRSSVDALIGHTGLERDAVRTTLLELEHADIVVRVDPAGRLWDAAPPDQVTNTLLRLEDDRRDRMREVGDELARMFWFARWDRGHYPAIEVIEDPAVLLSHHRNLQLGATELVRGVDRPPYVCGEGCVAGQEELQLRRMSEGVRYRTIYDDRTQRNPRRGAGMMAAIAAGEQARVLDDPPMKVLLADDRCALLALPPFDSSRPVAVMVRPSGLLTTLISVFDSLWRLSVPISLDSGPAALDDRDRGIITLMASGATDDAIARQLGLSRRTVVRRTSMLLDRLGATTRFQAGVQAARRGWL